MKKIEGIKIIRKELFKKNGLNGADFTDWRLIRALSSRFNLQDTAYIDKIFAKDKKGLLEDYLLDLKYWRNRGLTN
jgi:hypothetical protein